MDNPLYNIINSNNYINNNNKKLDWTDKFDRSDKLDRSDMSDDESDKSNLMDNPLYNIINNNIINDNNNYYYDHQICYLPTIRSSVCLWIESCEWEEKNVFNVQFIKKLKILNCFSLFLHYWRIRIREFY